MNDTTIPMKKIQIIYRFRSKNWDLPEYFQMRLTQWTLRSDCPVNSTCSCTLRCACGKVYGQQVHSVDLKQVVILFHWGQEKCARRVWYRTALATGWLQWGPRTTLVEQQPESHDELFKKAYQIVPVFSLVEYSNSSMFEPGVVRFITETMAYQTEVRVSGSPLARTVVLDASPSQIYGYEWCSPGRHYIAYHRLHAIGVSLISRMGRFGDA